MVKKFNEFDIIPDDLLIWTLEHYYTNNKPTTKVKVPNRIFENSKKYLNNHNTIYRGVYIRDEEKYDEIVSRGYYLSNGVESWTFNLSDAMDFAGGGDQKLILTYDLNKVDKMISIDYIMDNIPEEQLDTLSHIKIFGEELKKTFSYYLSESEVLVFDQLKVPLT